MHIRSAGVLLCLGMVACQDAATEPETFVVPVFDHNGRDHQMNFRPDRLEGANEVPPRATTMYGQAFFHFTGDSLYYRLVVHAADNVTQAHIHLAAPGVNGNIVAWLYPAAPPATLIPGRFKGVLAEGYIVDSEVISDLAGQGVMGLVQAMRDGNTYVNVHTTTFPGGEVRGQIP